MSDSAGSIIGLDPTRGTPAGAGEAHLAPRPRSLEGAVIGLISNGKEQARLLLVSLYAELERLARLRDSVVIDKRFFYAPPTEEDWQRLKSQVTVAVAAFGG
jgi:hypothetical protein